jgi:2-C-methyl-D-erythritol 4-phosphate cytidylyltransferase/2-C-methyl-D-erythritol 2,4-cyclodiphosphate synthase
MHVTAIIAAGGRGTRFGGAQLKQLRLVGGRAILDRSVGAFVSHPAIAEVIVALPDELVLDPPSYLWPADSGGASKPLRIVAGGARRQDSVAHAFQAADTSSDVIVIHDAARPFASADLVARTIAAAAESGAALAALQARDTVKRTMWRPASAGPGASPPEGGHHVSMVAETLPRESIYLAQTPQAFRRDILLQALAYGARESIDVTDEATLAERAGFAVRLVEGEPSNIKITTSDDMTIAEAIARNQSRIHDPQSAFSTPQFANAWIGTGYDLHLLVAGRPLIVAGVTLASPRGALGHSDADVACHAITDAILGAARVGDIGRQFPDTDARWKEASSLDLLARATALVRDVGYEIGNVDVTVILEEPKIRDHIDAMRRALAAAIGVDPGAISVKGKTNEGVDAVGRGEAIAAHAVALLHRRIPNP